MTEQVCDKLELCWASATLLGELCPKLPKTRGIFKDQVLISFFEL